MLFCFISIADSTTQKLAMSQASNKLDLTQEQIEKLTNMYEIEKNILRFKSWIILKH